MTNPGSSTMPLPRRADDHRPLSPSALQRRETFERRHPEIDIRAARVNGRMQFHVREPGRDKPSVWADASQMMDDLEKRYPSQDSRAAES
jgi:hypothetical protein